MHYLEGTVLTSNISGLSSTVETMMGLENSTESAVLEARAKGMDVEVMDYARDNLVTYLDDNTVILNIEGHLIPTYSWLEAWVRQIISYEAIQAAVALILEDEDVTKVILRINSPGGYASGCGETADLLYALRGIKRELITYTNTTMASGAYWLGSQASTVVASKYSHIGSIGAYTSYMTRSRMIDEAGVDVYVARSADRKGRPSGIEPLSKFDQEVLDNHTKGHADMFIQGILQGRGNKLSGSDWSSGETFTAGQAMKLHLIDGLRTEQEVINAVKIS